MYLKSYTFVCKEHIKGLLGGKEVFLFFFLFFLSKKYFSICGIRKYRFHNSYDEVWHKVNRNYSRQVMSMSKSTVDTEGALSKYLLCTVWCNNMHLCPICKVSHMLTGWCQLNSHVTVRLLLTVWPGSAHPNPRFGYAVSYMILSLGKNQTPSPSSWLLFLKKASQVLFIKIFHHLAHAKYFRSYSLLKRQKIQGFCKAWEVTG